MDCLVKLTSNPNISKTAIDKNESDFTFGWQILLIFDTSHVNNLEYNARAKPSLESSACSTLKGVWNFSPAASYKKVEALSSNPNNSYLLLFSNLTIYKINL